MRHLYGLRISLNQVKIPLKSGVLGRAGGEVTIINRNSLYLCGLSRENGQSSEGQHACMIGRVAPDEGKANGLHLGKERALCTRFAPSLSHAFSQRHHFILLNYPVELRPRTRFSEQIQIHIEAAHHSADFYHSVFGAVAGLTGYVGRGLRFLYAHTDSASPYQTLMREL